MNNRCDSSSSSLSSMSSFGACALRSASPKSPPPGLDLYDKRRHIVKVKVLEREITLLQEELRLLDGLEPASRCCKELDTYIESIRDPFIVNTKQKNDKPHHFWNKICLRRICCFNGSLVRLNKQCTSADCPSSKTQCSNSSCLEKRYYPKGCRFAQLSCWSCSCCYFNLS